MISSGCSLASAARTTCSTSLASRTFRVSTISDEAPVGCSPANSDGAVDADRCVDNKPVGPPDAALYAGPRQLVHELSRDPFRPRSRRDLEKIGRAHV